MGRLVNHLVGTAYVSVTGQFPERVINLCAQNAVDFWGVDWTREQTIKFFIFSYGIEKTRDCAEKVNCTFTVEKRYGFPEELKKFKQRYAFLIGLALSLLAVSVLSCFVFSVEVSGNEKIPDAIILQNLQRFGIHPGAYGPALDRRQIEQEILLELKDLSWIAINMNGTKVEVQVIERQLAPDRVDEEGYYDIVSETNGIVARVEPELGDAMVKSGDTVGKGEVLISGCVTLEPPQYSELPNRYYYLHARGRVWARTWREITASIPMKSLVKQYTEKEDAVWSIIFFGNRVEIFGNSRIRDGFCDKITKVYQLKLSEDTALPVWVVCERYRQYDLDLHEVELGAAVSLVESGLKNRIQTLIGSDGQMVQIDFKTRVSNDLILVSAAAECLEEIGREVPGLP